MMKKKFIPLFILLFYMLNINSQEFTHPGLLHSESSLKRIRELVRNEIQPAYGSFNIMRGMPEGKADYCIKGPSKLSAVPADMVIPKTLVNEILMQLTTMPFFG